MLLLMSRQVNINEVQIIGCPVLAPTEFCPDRDGEYLENMQLFREIK